MASTTPTAKTAQPLDPRFPKDASTSPGQRRRLAGRSAPHFAYRDSASMRRRRQGARPGDPRAPTVRRAGRRAHAQPGLRDGVRAEGLDARRVRRRRRAHAPGGDCMYQEPRSATACSTMPPTSRSSRSPSRPTSRPSASRPDPRLWLRQVRSGLGGAGRRRHRITRRALEVFGQARFMHSHCSGRSRIHCSNRRLSSPIICIARSLSSERGIRPDRLRHREAKAGGVQPLDADRNELAAEAQGKTGRCQRGQLVVAEERIGTPSSSRASTTRATERPSPSSRSRGRAPSSRLTRRQPRPRAGAAACDR